MSEIMRSIPAGVLALIAVSIAGFSASCAVVKREVAPIGRNDAIGAMFAAMIFLVLWVIPTLLALIAWLAWH
jgi:hypothetical protein